MSVGTCEHWQVASWLPRGRCGAWEVRDCAAEAGATELVEYVDDAERLWMDDRPAEWRAHQAICDAAQGRMLLLGLGLGMLPSWLARQESVQSITIVERSRAVMRLVEPHLITAFASSKGIRVIHADASGWQPEDGERYNVAWVDITAGEPLNAVDREAWRSRLSPWCDRVLCWEGAACLLP